MAMNSKNPVSKIGLLDIELNFLTKLLFGLMVILSLLLLLVQPLIVSWLTVIQFNRYLILLSNIIPISMRVNLDFAKLIYCFRLSIDKEIEGTIPRSSTIPEELGRIQYLLTDKTGTLT